MWTYVCVYLCELVFTQINVCENNECQTFFYNFHYDKLKVRSFATKALVGYVDVEIAIYMFTKFGVLF